jgi:DNA-binding PadR family transcriptional regulator
VPARTLTPTSYVILGLLQFGPATPYGLKSRVDISLGHFWVLQQAQLYRETERLAKDGLLSEEREEKGRRRRIYSITDAGRKAFAGWLGEPSGHLPEVRDIGLLQLFLGADPKSIASVQLEAHRAQLAKFEALHDEFAKFEPPKGMLLALETGITHEREFVRFWSTLA